MKINVTYDSSVTDLDLPGNPAYNPTLYDAYTSAVTTAVDYYDHEITNNITVNISFGWGESGGMPVAPGASGQSVSEQYDGYSYSQLRAALTAADTTSAVQLAAAASLAPTDPTNGASFNINTAELKALGLAPATDPASDGAVGLDSSGKTSWAWPGQAYTPGSSDAVGTLEHEISEVLGRVDTGGANNAYDPLDLFRYTSANGQANDPIGAAAGARDEPFIAGYNSQAASYFSYNGSTVGLMDETPGNVAKGADVGDWAPSVGYDSFGDAPTGAPTHISATDMQELNVLGYDEASVVHNDEPAVCYLRGTRILTPTGEARVENINIGDEVVTRFNGTQAVKWIGRQSFDARFVKNTREHFPVCIQAGALGVRCPARDLYVSPGHSMLIDGKLILAQLLVNGINIMQDRCPPVIDYFQMELQTHDCVIAEGTWSESFADGPGMRARFDNAAEFAELYPNDAPPAELVALCAPRPEHGPKLAAVLGPIVARAASALQPGPLRGCVDTIDLPWAMNGWAQDTNHPELPVLLEVVLGNEVLCTALACDFREDLAAARIGQGFAAFSLTLPVRVEASRLGELKVRRAIDGFEIPLPAAGAGQASTKAIKAVA